MGRGAGEGPEERPVMTHPLGTGRTVRRAVLALAVLSVWPALSDAGWLGLRNDTAVPIVVQGASIVNGLPRRGKPQLLYPGEVAWECILIPGNKLIEVYDPKQPRRPPLHQETITCGADDLFYSIQLDPPPKTDKPPPRGQAPALPKYKLVPDKPTGPPPGMAPRR